MGFSHLLSSRASLANFRVTYNVPEDVDIAYCHEGDIDIQRHRGENTVFFPLMAILEGGVRFPVDPLILGTLRFYELCPDQLPPNFYRMRDVGRYMYSVDQLLSFDLTVHLLTEIFIHWDGQLRASHLILGVEPVYSTWQTFSQALLVDSPLLSYIDVRHSSFLPSNLTVEQVSRRRRELIHVPVQTETPVHQEDPANQEVFAETTEHGQEMVARRTLSVSRFMPGAQQSVAQPGTLAQQTPTPPAPPVRARKRQRAAEQEPIDTGDVPVRTPPRSPAGTEIREHVAQTGLQVASSSRAAPAWCPSFILDGKPFPSTASVRVWDKGEGGRVAQSLARGLLLPEDVHVFYQGTDESLARRLQWHTIAAAQMTHILDGRLKELAEDAGREKALKDVAKTAAKEKAKAVAVAEKKAMASEKAKAAVERRSMELEAKLSDAELKLGEVESLNAAQAEELADMRAALEASESKWYNERFADAENSMEPIIQEVQRLAFEEAWFAALRAAGVPEDSPLRDSSQIPFPGPSSAAQVPLAVNSEEDTPSMRELVDAIDSHVKLVDLEITSNIHADDQPAEGSLPQSFPATEHPPKSPAQSHTADQM
ncbi:hypothetical protein SO802_018841 [Lithocarpus litseifolius]|uniref:Transposase (Putative), gypsy type n=1 Tax=Lithocarpus litseifolius TaxID=425828 RepID=A0AAW2CN45_9ROSI